MILVMGLVACSSSKEKPSADFDEQPWEVTVESPLDSMTVTTYGQTVENRASETLADPDPPEGTEVGTPVLDTPEVTETRTPVRQEEPPPQVFTPGWRVQIFASASMVNADELARVARTRFSEPVYVEYEPPMYKVRVGDFFTKSAASSMKTRVHAEDYQDAFIVEAMVVRPNQ